VYATKMMLKLKAEGHDFKEKKVRIKQFEQFKSEFS
jgi:hypothetical protein